MHLTYLFVLSLFSLSSTGCIITHCLSLRGRSPEPNGTGRSPWQSLALNWAADYCHHFTPSPLVTLSVTLLERFNYSFPCPFVEKSYYSYPLPFEERHHYSFPRPFGERVRVRGYLGCLPVSAGSYLPQPSTILYSVISEK